MLQVPLTHIDLLKRTEANETPSSLIFYAVRDGAYIRGANDISSAMVEAGG